MQTGREGEALREFKTAKRILKRQGINEKVLFDQANKVSGKDKF